MGGDVLLAQKYQPKYLRENNENFKRLILRADNDGWIEFKKEAKLNPNTFFKDYGSSLGLDRDYNFKVIFPLGCVLQHFYNTLCATRPKA